MARTVRDAKLDTRNARLKLGQRREPYWRTISEGLAIGYRRGAKGGTWIARHYAPSTGRRYSALGTADDVADADGVHVVNFTQAQEAARRWFADLAAADGKAAGGSGPYTVREAMADYLAWYRRHRKAADRTAHIVNAFILPELGDADCGRLTADRLRRWHELIADFPPRARTRKGEAQRFRAMPDTIDAKRARKATANRQLGVLKAALNHAFKEGKITNDGAWRRVKPFREAGAAKVRYLTDQEARRLVNACPADLRRIVQAALLSGARFGELAAATVRDFNPDSGTLHIPIAKSGHGRHVVLTDEGRAFLEALAAGKPGDHRLFVTAAGATWERVNHHRLLRRACKVATIAPAISFHELRHTYASRLAMRGVGLQVIAEQLGHADTRITQQHYAHLGPSYMADTIRANFPALGIVAAPKVVAIGKKSRRR